MNLPAGSSPLGIKAASNNDGKPNFRTKTIATRLTPEELMEVESAAERAGKPLAEWLRNTALDAARRRPSDTLEFLLAEVWAVRYALLNLFWAGAQANLEGKALPPEFVAKIRSEADMQKLEHARKLIDEHVQSQGRNGEM
jgi:hypothetical protein